MSFVECERPSFAPTQKTTANLLFSTFQSLHFYTACGKTNVTSSTVSISTRSRKTADGRRSEGRRFRPSDTLDACCSPVTTAQRSGNSTDLHSDDAEVDTYNPEVFPGTLQTLHSNVDRIPLPLPSITSPIHYSPFILHST